MRESVSVHEYEVVHVSPSGVVHTRGADEGERGLMLYFTPQDFEESDRALLRPGAVIRREQVHRLSVLAPDP